MSSSTSQQADDAARSAQRDAEKAGRDAQRKAENVADDVKKSAKDLEKKASRAAHDAKDEAAKAWDTFSNNPEYWASTLASVNLLLVGGLGVYAYVKRDEVKRMDKGVLALAVGGVAGLLGLQSYFATEEAKKQNRRPL